jgi:hypothetical protein
VSVESHGSGDDDGDAGWVKLLTLPSELSGSPTNRDIWEQVGGMYEGMRISISASEMRQRIFNIP